MVPRSLSRSGRSSRRSGRTGCTASDTSAGRIRFGPYDHVHTRLPRNALGHPTFAPFPNGVTTLSKTPEIPLTFHSVVSRYGRIGIGATYIQRIYQTHGVAWTPDIPVPEPPRERNSTSLRR